MKNWQELKSNPELFQRFFVKEYTLRAIRSFFQNINYHEIESPILTDCLPQERYLDVLNTLVETEKGNYKAYLIPTTETFNKRILAAGIGNHFVISKVFRAIEQVSPNHSPEFTMLEWYTLGGNYQSIMDETEKLINSIIEFLISKSSLITAKKLNYQGQNIEFDSPWIRMTVKETFTNYANANLDNLLSADEMRAFAISKGINSDETDDWQTLFELVFSQEIDPKLPKDKPLFLYDFPKILCPLVRQKKEDERYCEKVELYIAGKEVANGYTELTDPVEQRKRFDEERVARIRMGKEPVKYDEEIIKAMESGIPDVAGIGMGIDRLVMLLTNSEKISDINYFPFSEMFE